MAHSLTGYLRFLWAGLAKGGQTGALVPSQRYLVDKMISPIPRSYRGEIVELGAGTGALTLRLAKRCPKAKIIACEINPALAKDLRRNLDRAGINGQVQVVSEPAQRVLPKLLKTRKTGLDYVISGIPLGNVPKDQTFELLRAIGHSLSAKGMYIQFQHSLMDRKKIKATFKHLDTVPVLLNFPPAFVYYALKEQPAPRAARRTP